MNDSQCAVATALEEKILFGILYHFLVVERRVARTPIEKNTRERSAEKRADGDPDAPKKQGVRAGGKYAVLDPAVISRAVILSCIGRHSHAERFEHTPQKIVDFRRSRVCRHHAGHSRVEGIERGIAV